MLPAGARLRRRVEFVATLRGGRGARGDGLVVVHIDRSGHWTGPARVGFIVSRSVGPAVTRNLVKRRLRHVMARRLGDLPTGARVVVRALPASATATSTQLDAAINRATQLAPARRAGR
ncbi:MAG: ribonuclease P protein component [Actinomycetes bacterium]